MIKEEQVGTMINGIAFERAVLNILKNDNPGIKESYAVDDEEHRFYYDAVCFDGVLHLSEFGADDIAADRIAIEIKMNNPSLWMINKFISRAQNDFDAIVFIIGGKIKNDFKTKIRNGYFERNIRKECRIFFIMPEELSSNSEIAKFMHNPAEYIANDNSVIFVDKDQCIDRLNQSKDNLAFALGAGCSRASHISDWSTLSTALGYEMLYHIVNAEESISSGSEYRKKIIADKLNEHVFYSFESTSAVDAIHKSFLDKSRSKQAYWNVIKNVLYMSYDCNKDFDTPLMKAIAECIKRNSIDEIINYNFDSVLEQQLDSKYKSTTKQISCSEVEINGCKIFHVHGYIPFDYSGKTDVGNFIFTDSEYYENSIKRNSFTNRRQREVFESKTVVFIGVSFVDANMKEILRELNNAPTEGRSNKIFAFYKEPKFEFEGTNNTLLEKYYKLLYDTYFGSLGVTIIWVKNYDEIPEIINKI